MIDNVINSLFLHMDQARNPSQPLGYLEIGVDYGHTFGGIRDKLPSGTDIMKVGIDPYGTYTEGVTRMTSQMYFALNKTFWHHKFDIIYIDGCHFAPIINQEIEESLKILNPNGIILLDDTVPQTEESQRVVPEDLVSYCESVSFPVNISHTEAVPCFTGYPHVQGDAWKSVAALRMTRPDLSICSSPPWCTTFVMRGEQELIKERAYEKMDWEYYRSHFNDILNPIQTMAQLESYVKKNEGIS